MGMLEEKDKFLDVISRETAEDTDIHVYIGTEDESDAMRNTALIFKKVNIGGKELAVGVIGPKRMNYQHVIDMISKLASGIEKLGTDSTFPMIGDGQNGGFDN